MSIQIRFKTHSPSSSLSSSIWNPKYAQWRGKKQIKASKLKFNQNFLNINTFELLITMEIRQNTSHKYVTFQNLNSIFQSNLNLIKTTIKSNSSFPKWINLIEYFKLRLVYINLKIKHNYRGQNPKSRCCNPKLHQSSKIFDYLGFSHWNPK